MSEPSASQDTSTSQDAKPRERSPTTDAEWAALAASLAAQKPDAAAQSASAARAHDARGGMPRGGFASSLALLLAVIATMVAGFLWWQYRQFYVSLDQTDASAALALERVRADLRALQDGVEDLGDDLESSRQLTTALAERVDQVPGRLVDLERRLDAVQGGSFDARGDWIKSEAEYYLTVANTELALAGHWENAIKALELADARLAELGDPSLSAVRDAIAGELLALRSVRLPDIEGLVFSLGRLASRIDELPLRADLPTNFADQKSALEDAEPGLARLWLGIKSALLGIVRVERREQPVGEAFSTAERLLARRQLALELELARTAALRTQPEAFQSSLKSAQELLRRDFSSDSAEVEGALALLDGMLELRLTPERPDISRSLNLLRTLQLGAN
jgi:uroporphyrin-3 C-methyltransferase